MSPPSTLAPNAAAPVPGDKLLRRLITAMLLGVLVYAGFALYGGIADIGERLARYSWSTFAIACALALGNYVLRYFKWEYYLAKLGIRGVPKLDSFLVFLSGFVLTVTPGKVGEVFKSFLLYEKHEVPIARTAPIVVAERLTDVIGVVALILMGTSGFPGGVTWAIAGGVLVLLALAAIGSERVVNFSISLLEKLPGRFRSLAPKVREAWESLRVVTTPRALVWPSVLSIVAWWLEGIALWMILKGFDEPVPMPLACFFYATATLAGALVPIPGGLGITEGALEEQLTLLGGVTGATAMSAMILVRFATLWLAVLVGFVAFGIWRAKYPKVARSSVMTTGEGQ